MRHWAALPQQRWKACFIHRHSHHHKSQPTAKIGPRPFPCINLVLKKLYLFLTSNHQRWPHSMLLNNSSSSRFTSKCLYRYNLTDMLKLSCTLATHRTQVTLLEHHFHRYRSVLFTLSHFNQTLTNKAKATMHKINHIQCWHLLKDITIRR